MDWAGLAEANYSSSKLYAHAILRQINVGFDMNGPGFTTWRGRQATAMLGPVCYDRGPFRQLTTYASIGATRDWDYDSTDWDWGLGWNASGYLRNQTTFGAWAGWNHSRYSSPATGPLSALPLSPSAHSSWHRYSGAYFGASAYGTESGMFNLGAWANFDTRTFNYRRSVLAPSATGAIDIGFRPGDRLSSWVTTEFTAEFPDTGRVEPRRDLTVIYRPWLGYSITPKMDLSLSSEIVSRFDVALRQPDSGWRLSVLFSWTFLPRSTVYFAWNWNQGTDQPVHLVQVLKVRYLLVF
jgi:hypothetical protein